MYVGNVLSILQLTVDFLYIKCIKNGYVDENVH